MSRSQRPSNRYPKGNASFSVCHFNFLGSLAIEGEGQDPQIANPAPLRYKSSDETCSSSRLCRAALVLRP